MSPPAVATQPAFEFGKPCSAQISKSADSFNFSSTSSDAARFDYSKSGSEKPRISSRSRPRLMKMRRRQMLDGKTVKTDLGLNGFSDGGGEKEFEGKLGNEFGNNNVNLGSDGGEEKSCGLNGNVNKVGNGFDFDVELDNSLYGFGSGKFTPLFDAINGSMPSNFSFDFDKGWSTSVQKETEDFVLPNSSFSAKDPSDSDSKVKLAQQGFHKSDEFVKFDTANFEFGAMKTDKNAGSTIHDVRGKVKLDGSGDSEKVSNPSFKFPFNLNDDSSNGLENSVFTSHSTDFKFNIGLENKTAGKKGDMPNFSQSSLDDVFLFGGLKGKGGIDSGGSTKPVNEMNRLNSEKAGDCNVSQLHSHDSGAGINGKYQASANSGDSFEQGPIFALTNKMKKLHIGDSKADATKSGNFTCNSASVADNVFVFGGNQRDSGFVEEKKTPDMNCFSLSNFKSTKAYSTVFPSTGMGVELNSGSQEAPSMDKDGKDNMSFRGKQAGLSSDADCITPDMEFAFSSNNLFPSVDKSGDTSFKSLRDKKSKKRNGKQGQRTGVQQLFLPLKEGSSQKNHESPSFGSPMDFSPFQDTSASNAPEAETDAGVKVESSAKKKNISEQWEIPEDEKNTSTYSPSLPSNDSLSAAKRQYQKKYKLKVGLSPSVQGKNSEKVNVKKEPIGTPYEVCEQWRIRGNEAYRDGKLSKAEEFYSLGIDSCTRVSTPGYPLKLLSVCYSNRAATRMSLSRMREAIADCTKASELDPDSLKVIQRAGNCYLVLGEVEDAIQCYSKCLRDGNSICLDRRFIIEAAGSLQKAEKVAQCMNQSAELLQEGTDDAASKALGSIDEALSISQFSERLIQMKGEAMYILRRYDEVIQHCEQTLDISEKNSQSNSSHVKLWRWALQSKSHFRLGKLDLALDLIEKQEKVGISSTSESAYVTKESSIALATTIRELLSLKESGNDAFKAGKYTDAIESYTSAISKSFESRVFMAVCFCNRAAAYQSLSQIVDAISDCSVAIALDEDYAKAISRRATLHEMIRDYKQAHNDIQRLVSLLESQSQSKTGSRSDGGSVRDLRKVRRRLASVEEKAKKDIPLDLYLILGIKASDTESEIKKAYRKAALRHHPDKAGQVLVRSDAGDDGKLWKECGEKIHDDSDRLFKIIGEAYAVLSDPSKRSNYDMEEELRNSIHRDSNRNSSCEHPSTSYMSPFERGGRSGSYGTSYGRSSYRRNWYEAYPKTYAYSRPQW